MSQTLRGLVISEETGEAITGAVVRAEGTAYYAISGLDGSFVIRKMPKGDYRIMVSMIGFVTETRRLTMGDSTQLPVIELKTSRK